MFPRGKVNKVSAFDRKLRFRNSFEGVFSLLPTESIIHAHQPFPLSKYYKHYEEESLTGVSVLFRSSSMFKHTCEH